MNEKLLAGIGVGTASLIVSALVLRAGAQNSPVAITTVPPSGKSVMRMHCSSCRVVRPETVEDPIVLESHRYWRGPLPVPQGYTHWVPPTEEYAIHAPDLPVIPLPEIIRGTIEERRGNETELGFGGEYSWINPDGSTEGVRFSSQGGPMTNTDDVIKERKAKEREQDIDRMLKDYKNKR